MDAQKAAASVAREAAWRRSALALLAALGGTLALFLILVIVLDPYDSGRFPTFMPAGSPDERPPTVDISRGRDPRFDALALGSSRAVLLDAHQLSEPARYRFAQMAAEGTTPREHMVLLHWFARHHARVEAIVVATDQPWCDRDPDAPGMSDFPYGLYADGDLAYFKTTLSSATFNFMRDRVLYALGRKPGVDPGGFIDFETKYPWRLDRDPHHVWPRSAPAAAPQNVTLPALDRFDAALAELPDQPRIVLWMPPYLDEALPPPDSNAGRDLAACKAALQRWADRRPGTAFVDFAIRSPQTADPDNFLDPTHVRRRYMRTIADEVAAAVGRLK